MKGVRNSPIFDTDVYKVGSAVWLMTEGINQDAIIKQSGPLNILVCYLSDKGEWIDKEVAIDDAVQGKVFLTRLMIKDDDK